MNRKEGNLGTGVFAEVKDQKGMEELPGQHPA